MEVIKTESSDSANIAENVILNVEKRIQKVQELNIVIDKRRKLQEAVKNEAKRRGAILDQHIGTEVKNGTKNGTPKKKTVTK